MAAPRATMASLRIGGATSTSLAALNCLVAGAILVAPWLGTPVGDPARAARGGSDLVVAFTYLWVFAAQTSAAGAVLLGLTWCEYAGIRFIAARRGWRLTKAGAWQVCCSRWPTFSEQSSRPGAWRPLRHSLRPARQSCGYGCAATGWATNGPR